MSDRSTMIEYLKTLKNQEASKSKYERAAERIYVRCIERLQELAKSRLPPPRRRTADEEDVAQAAMASFFRGVKKGRFPELNDENDLWQVLIMLAERKAIDEIRRQTAEKQGGGNVRGESVWEPSGDATSQAGGLDGLPEGTLVPRYEPTPWFAVLVAEEFQRWMQLLATVDRRKRDNPVQLQEVAQLRFEGWNVAEIAERFCCVPRTIERRLTLIRRIWRSAVVIVLSRVATVLVIVIGTNPDDCAIIRP